LKRRAPLRALVVRTGWIAASVAAGSVSLLLVFADFASLMNNHRDVRYLITPGNVLASLAENSWGQLKRPGGQQRVAVGADATLAPASLSRRPQLFVLVVGETARAQNFSLNGYPRSTAPELARHGVINFPHATACGTSTEVSLPCMFSPFGRAHYDEKKIRTHESVLHVLAHAGVDVLWRDNQAGCKGVCDGLPHEQLDAAGDASLCASGQCMDEILLRGMDQVLRDHRGNLFVVMHQLGSHGPAYFRRYPPAFRKFTPACENDDLRGCSPQEVVNAYDNSLLYTDFFLGKLIDFLDAAQKTHDTAMLYVSDHGESLGEGGLYLHGMPWAIAPHAQTQVPFVLWVSPSFRESHALDLQCERDRANGHLVSHDNLFHSLLGIFGVQTRAYDPTLDVFAPCRG
jgi:lipid A ethanolaminephosphotransferase